MSRNLGRGQEEGGERRKTLLKIVLHTNTENSAWSWFNFC